MKTQCQIPMPRRSGWCHPADRAPARPPMPTGAVTVRTDARNWPTTYTQDLLGRTVGVQCMDATLVTNTFDVDGRQIAMADSTGIVTTTFDEAGQPRTVNNWVGRPLTYTLDAVGNRTRLDDCDGRYWTYTWDPDNRLGRVYSNYGQSTTLTNDALGRETQRVLANGVSIDRTYDPAGRETVISARKADGTLNALYSATYDPVGNRLHVDGLDGSTVDYGYDANYRLTNETRVGAHGFNVTMTFDAVGNRATKQDSTGTTACDYNAANELTLVTPPTGAPTSFAQDANGNVVLEQTGTDETTYEWDLRHEVAWKIVTRDRPDVTGCPITRTLRGLAARQLAVWSPPTTYPTGQSRAPEPRGDGASASIRR